MVYETRIFGTSRGAAFVNIAVALVKWLQNRSFDAEYTIRQLTTNMLNMAFVEKMVINEIF